MIKKIKNSLQFRFIFLCFIGMLISSIVVFTAVYITTLLGINFKAFNIFLFLLILFIFNIIIGTILFSVLSKKTIDHQKEIENVIKEVSKGNFDVQITKSLNTSKDLDTNLNNMIKELKNIEILRSDFISNFSHEFKTPIVSINGFTDLLLNDNTLTENEKQEYLEIIHNESTRLSNLSQNMLLLSDLESKSILREQSSFRLDQQINSTIKLLEKDYKNKNITISTKLENTTINANKELLQQAWINLISNAIKYSKTNGNISIKLHNRDNNVIISIKDNGIGINKESLTHIFDKFYQEDKSHKTQGNGLGLSITKKIIDIHEGKIDVFSEKDIGTEFIITLKRK